MAVVLRGSKRTDCFRRLAWRVASTALFFLAGCSASVEGEAPHVAWAPSARVSPPIQPSPLLPSAALPPASAQLSFEVRAPEAGWPSDGRETLLTFVQLSDTHVGRGRDQRSFAEAVEAINALQPRPAFVVITGDLTETFAPREVQAFKDTLAKLEVPARLVPGNHDEGFDPSDRSIRFFLQHFPEHATPYAFDAGPLTLVGVDSQLFNARRRSPSSSGYADAQWERLEGLLKEAQARGRRIVLFHHIPFYPSWEPHKGLRPMWDASHLAAWRELLARYDVEAELTGHFHRDELYADGETLLLNAPPISEKFGRHPSFRLFRVTSAGLTLRQVYFRARDAHHTYEVDLHGIGEAQVGAWALGLAEGRMREHWRRRQTWASGADGWFDRMDRERWRQHLIDPLQKAEPGVRSLGVARGVGMR